MDSSNDIFTMTRVGWPKDISIPFLRGIAKSYTSLLSGLVFFLCIEEDRICYISLNSMLAKRLRALNLESHSFKYLVKTLSGMDVRKIDKILSVITNYFKDGNIEVPEDYVFMTDLAFCLNPEGHALATYKFVPYLLDADLKIKYLVGSVSFSTGHYINKLLIMDNMNMNMQIYDLPSESLTDFEIKPLSEVEGLVLGLSAQGRQVPEIARLIHKAPETVKSIRRRILAKFRVKNITEAVIFAQNHKLI